MHWVVFLLSVSATWAWLLNPRRRRAASLKTWGRMCDRLGYDPAARHRVEVPSAPDGRPGYTLTLPSRPNFVSVIAKDDSRNDFLAMVGPATLVRAVCFGADHRPQTPDDSAFTTLNHLQRHRVEVRELPTPTELVGERAVRYRYALPSGLDVTEWKFTRDGWLFCVGIQTLEIDPAAERRATEALQSWTWT